MLASSTSFGFKSWSIFAFLYSYITGNKNFKVTNNKSFMILSFYNKTNLMSISDIGILDFFHYFLFLILARERKHTPETAFIIF
jgi:hypothetical protein